MGKFLREDDVRKRSEFLVRSAGVERPPVPIQPLLESCRAEVAFRPMLVAGYTAEAGPHEFLIYANCDLDFASNFDSMLRNPEDEGRNLPARTRFTIAHELTHTFFFKFDAQGRPEDTVRPKNDDELAHLEDLCDIGASTFLMPDFLITPRLLGVDVADPSLVFQLSSEYRLSLEATLYRLTELDAWRRLQGAGIFLINNRGGSDRIRAWKLNSHIKGLFPPLGKSPKLLDLHVDLSELRICGGTKNRTRLSLKAEPEPVSVTFRQHNGEGSSKSTVITACIE